MNIAEYIQTNYLELKVICKNITKNHELHEDLCHFSIEIMLKYDNTKMQDILNRNHAKYFFVSIVLNQWASSTSPFYKQFRKTMTNEFIDNYEIMDEVYDEHYDMVIEMVEDMLQHETWYIKKLIELKKDMSYSQINELTKIPRSSLHSSVSKFKNKVIKKLKDGSK